MIRALKQSYGGAVRFALACPILFAVPALVEFAQHVAEVHIGFYHDIGSMRAVEHDWLRLGIGHAKIFSLILSSYWVTRFLGFGDDAVAAGRLDRRTIKLMLPWIAWSLILIVVELDAPIIGVAMGFAARPLAIAALVLMVSMTVLGLGLYPWACALVLGNPDIGFLRSLRFSWGRYWWALALSLVATLPLMAVHYALGYGAVARPTEIVWAMVAVDALVVSALSATMSAAAYVIASRVTAEHGVALIPTSLGLVNVG